MSINFLFFIIILCYLQDIVCSVKIVDCDAENDFIPKVKRKQQVPGEAHDLRIEPFAKAKPKQKGESYQLSVDISWQTPPENATVHLEGFLLEIEHEKGIERTCFLFNVSETNWTSKAIMSSPRFHFSTDSVFKFDQIYDVTLTSLPEMHNFSRSVTKTIKMPHNPSQNEIFNHVAENCTKFSHPFASKWTAGFRQIVLHDLARTIQLEFVAAPKQYCFEQYEVRLVDESGLELLHTDIISVENMKTEIIDNSTVYFGEYNFTNLDYDKTYVPSVIPVEKAADGRCLCPVDGTDPYDTKIVCSCVAAEGKPVKLKRLVLAETEIANVTLPSKLEEPNSGIWFIVFILFGSIVIIVCLMHLVRLVYRRYSASGKMVRIRFVQERQMENGGNAGGLLGPGVKAPLILNPNLNILIIYSHDSPEHEKAVMAFAEYLRDVFNFEVHMDQWDQDAIEANMMDYISASIINADKVIVINSIGANHRYHCKIANNGYTIERASPGIFDHIFLTQIDQALQHPFVVSTRFPYSSFNDVMPTLNGCLQYQVPDNLTQLLSALVGRSLKNDPRLAGYNSNFAKLQAAITQMEQLVQKDEKWFDHSHVRVPITLSPKRTVSPYLVTHELPVVSISKEDMTNLNEISSTMVTDNDSGVFDRTAMIPSSSTTTGVIDTKEEENIYENERAPMISDDETITSLPEQFTKIPVRNQEECIYSKLDDYRPDTSGDSGLVSDADLHLISAS
uniref:SEFIR domain-containing protein n=1 Tax=Panagrolaimus sp. JU765 TaxID=591449 RepID=A0AC34PW07_9BILA